MRSTMTNEATEIIEALGGSGKVAELCDITVGAVSQWKADGRIPSARLMYLKAVRPKVFKQLSIVKTARAA